MGQAQQRAEVAIDHFDDAKRFSREALRAIELGKNHEASRFATLAIQAAQDGIVEIKESERRQRAVKRKCLRDAEDENLQGPCLAGMCQWPDCQPAEIDDGTD